MVAHQFHDRYEIQPPVPGSPDRRQRVQQAATVPGARGYRRQLCALDHDVLCGSSRPLFADLGGLQVLLEAKELVRAYWEVWKGAAGRLSSIGRSICLIPRNATRIPTRAGV